MADESAYVNVNIRFAKVLKNAAKNYLDTQEKVLGRRLAFNQLVNDALIQLLEREGFLPSIGSMTGAEEPQERPY